jgi:hypothetical protein
LPRPGYRSADRGSGLGGHDATDKLWLDRRAHREQLQVDYAYEQRKVLLS